MQDTSSKAVDRAGDEEFWCSLILLCRCYTSTTTAELLLAAVAQRSLAQRSLVGKRNNKTSVLRREKVALLSGLV